MLGDFLQAQARISNRESELSAIWYSLAWTDKVKVAKRFGVSDSISPKDMMRFFPEMVVYLLGGLL